MVNHLPLNWPDLTSKYTSHYTYQTFHPQRSTVRWYGSTTYHLVHRSINHNYEIIFVKNNNLIQFDFMVVNYKTVPLTRNNKLVFFITNRKWFHQLAHFSGPESRIGFSGLGTDRSEFVRDVLFDTCHVRSKFLSVDPWLWM